MNKPSVTEGTGLINYEWPDFGLRVTAERYDYEGSAELSFYIKNGSGEALLHQTRANLLATTTMNQVVKRLERNSDVIPWTDILTYVTGKTIEIARRGEPVTEIWPNEEDTLEVEYLLDPVLYLNHPTVFFGEYGSLKSLIALAIAYIVQLPYYDNGLGLITIKEPTPCLYLDYEDDASSFRKRWSALERGFRQGNMPILHRRMTAPLADCVEEVRRIVNERKVKLLIIDSLGPASRGNLNDPEPAIRYHAALRQLGVTSLTLAHPSKDQLVKKATIFGSVFYTNLARAVWQCKAEQETGEDEAVISLKQTKANLSKIHPPLGFKVEFTHNTIRITKANLNDTGLSGELPLSVRIKDLLKGGAMTVNAIAEELDSNPDTIGRTLRRMRDRNQVIKLEDNSWGLKLN